MPKWNQKNALPFEMDEIKSLMSCIDNISKMIPEGTYLEMCDILKKVHANIPNDDDPPVIDNRQPRVNVPFQAIIPESDDEPWRPEWYDEWTQNEDMIRRHSEDLKISIRSLRTLKPIRRNTRKVKEAAMRYFTSRSPILDVDIFEGVPCENVTFDNYVRITNWDNFSLEDRREYTSKEFEKKIYAEYKTFVNYRIERLISETEELKRILEIEISDVRDRQSYLRVHYNL